MKLRLSALTLRGRFIFGARSALLLGAGLLPRAEFENVVRKAWTGLCTVCLQPDFRVGWSEGSTAQPIRTYRRDSHHLFSTGAFLIAGAEMGKR